MDRETVAKVMFWLCCATGFVLTGIGLRFLFVPLSAAAFFGIDNTAPGLAPHAVIALRDLWLGLLLIAFAVLRQWKAMSLWLGLGALVCFGDSAIAFVSSGQLLSVGFHVVSGFFLTWLCWETWQLADRTQD